MIDEQSLYNIYYINHLTNTFLPKKFVIRQKH